MKFSMVLSTLVFAGMLMAAPADKKAGTENGQAKDPVCGMTVDTKTAEKAEYKGKTYYFCSREEKETFEKTPDKYVAAIKKPEKDKK